MGHRLPASTAAALVLAGVVGCGGNANPLSPVTPSTPTPAPTPSPTRPPLDVVPGVRLTSITPPSGSTLAVTRCEFPADQYGNNLPRAHATATGARPLHENGDCIKGIVVNVDVQLSESALSRVLVQFVDGAFADGGIPCAGASWTGPIEAGTAREFVFSNFEVWCARPLTTNRLLITLSRCSPNLAHGPCTAVLARDEIPYAYAFGENP